jgi:alcohol dehydrogenase class IV
MVMSFEVATAARVVFGAGKVAEAPGLARELGVTRALVVTGRSSERAAGLRAGLEAMGIATAGFAVAEEPSVELARAGTSLAVRESCDGIVAFGGGSALDAGKAIAVLATNGGDPLDYLEVIGRGRPLTRPSLPLLAIPTTAGTGSEVTKNAVLADKTARLKASLRSIHMLPRVALIDPELLASVPRPVAAASGLDALSQLIEPFVSARANPFTDALAREGIRRSARSLAKVCDGGGDPQARHDVALASLFGGMCLANAGLGAVHGFAAPLGGMYDAPHGAVCAALLPAVLEINHRALRARSPAHPSLPRYDELGALLTGAPAARFDDALAFVRRLAKALEIPGLARWGLHPTDIPALVAKARVASSMRANAIVLEDRELEEIATCALGAVA